MAATYTESWSGRSSEKTDKDREWGREFQVVGATSNIEVYTATHATTGAPLPKIGDQDPDDPFTYVNRLSAPRWIGPRFAIVSAIYRINKPSGNTDDPISSVIRYRPRFAVQSEATDVSADGFPIVNSALEPFKSNPTGTFVLVGIDAIRNEPTFNIPYTLGFVDKINEDQFTIMGHTIEIGQAYCENIAPEREFTLVDTYVPVVYSFSFHELYPGEADPVLRSFFSHRLLDKGQRANAYLGNSVNKIVEILDSEGKPVSDDVFLNGAGIPIKATEYTFEAKKNEVQDADWQALEGPPAGATVITTATGMKALLYRRHLATPFSPLNL